MSPSAPPSGAAIRPISRIPSFIHFSRKVHSSETNRLPFPMISTDSVSPSSPAKKRGIALVLVLGFMVLVTFLVLAFFSSVTTELTSSKSYSDGASARGHFDSAVSAVMGIIREATSSGAGVAWCSQPGMLRTYDNAGAALQAYKLYSSDKMIVNTSKSGFDPAVDIEADWRTKSGLYTDLNRPIEATPNASYGMSVLHYPIVDPAAADPATGVEGFSLATAPGYSGKDPAPNNNPAPMPVKWIYLLRDGTMTAPDKYDTTTGIASFNTIGATPTKSNPIVGRMAFWTDDESCKVNINTASEGVYWDVPRIYSNEDIGRFDKSRTGLAIFQPARREYNRYPGHPATTCLSPVLGRLLPVTTPYPIGATGADAILLDPYAAIAPRVGLASGLSGGSEGGTVVPTGPVAVDSDRLYASVDELLFTANMLGTTRGPNASGKLSAEELEKRRFFLTASSSAPETTIFNTPRISLWPVNATTSARTTVDKLLAFCSTIGWKNYFFTRSNARSSTADYTGRNVELFTYLQGRTSTKIPGFGGNFLAKYGVDRDQILTYMYDYIRCINLADPSVGATPYTPIFDATNVTSNNTAHYASIMGAGEVVPIKIKPSSSSATTLRGFGRIYSISSAALVFYGTHKAATGATDKMQCTLLLEFVCPMQGMAGMMPNLKFKMLAPGLETFMVASRPLGFPAGGTNFIEVADVSTWGGRSIGGTEGPAMGLSNNWSNTKKIATGFAPGAAGAAVKGTYPFVTGQDFTFATPTPTFPFQGGNVTLEIRTQDSAEELVQTLRFSFPNGTFKTPGVSANFSSYNLRIVRSDGLSNGATGSLIQPEDTVVALEVAGANGNANDTAVDSTAGDTRMIESLGDVPATKFRPHQGYTTADTKPMAHGLVIAFGEGYTGATLGKLVNVPNYPIFATNGRPLQPDVPSRASTGVTRSATSGGGPGDWDTGIGDQKDGAYINKPDEGDQAKASSAPPHVAYLLGNAVQFQSVGDTFFSPNRQVPSSLMFGSLPTGVQRNLPWQTLLFHPRPEDTTHPGFGTPKVPAAGASYTLPPDHLIADLFWMPVVEPYAISQPFSTSGKLNLNYRIAPFTYITRSTGMHAAMKSTRFLALQLSDGPFYKPIDPPQSTPATIQNRRRSIDMTKTLADFEAKFNRHDLFRSASQICEMNLVPPEVSSSADMVAFWNTNKLTGDNMREKPYVDLYPRLTTKSNTYTVHVWAETLSQGIPKGTAASDALWAQWNEQKGQVTAQYRGSTLIERYIDPQDPALAKFDETYNGPTVVDGSGNVTKAGTLDPFYKFRVLSTKRFDR